ncbi:MAG: hypothetical protein V7707_14520 [Motiliproteus sp.]
MDIDGQVAPNSAFLLLVPKVQVKPQLAGQPFYRSGIRNFIRGWQSQYSSRFSTENLQQLKSTGFTNLGVVCNQILPIGWACIEVAE